MWECGLKQRVGLDRPVRYQVTPYVGVWIETEGYFHIKTDGKVTPYVGVWIETTQSEMRWAQKMSLLMWECGLKHRRDLQG